MKPGERVDLLEKVVAEYENDFADAPSVVGGTRHLHVAPRVLLFLFKASETKIPGCSTADVRDYMNVQQQKIHTWYQL